MITMIKIGKKQFNADQAIEIARDNEVPIQPVEKGFSVQDHIKISPLQVRVEVIIFDEEITLHGQWQCKRVNGKMECTEKTGVSERTGTYEYLMDLRDNRELVLVDCSEYARTAPMIYPDMAITRLGQLVKRGEIFYCTIVFTQITKTDIVSVPLYIQETTVDVDGETVETILWSKEPIEPVNVETLESPPAGASRYPPDKYGKVHRVPTVWQLVTGVIDTASAIAKGVIFGGNV